MAALVVGVVGTRTDCAVSSLVSHLIVVEKVSFHEDKMEKYVLVAGWYFKEEN